MDSISMGGVAAVAAAVLNAVPWPFSSSRNIARVKPTTKGERLRGLTFETSVETPEIDICFVHGLTRDAKSTWTGYNDESDKEAFWPTQFLANQTSLDGKAFPPVRLMYYNYDTDVNSLCWLAERTLYRNASNLLKDLIEARKDCPERPLLFVAHSLGGLLVRSALIFAQDVGSPATTEAQKIYLATFGVVSFGTPQTFVKKPQLSELVDRLCTSLDVIGPDSSGHTLRFEDFGSESWKQDIELLQRRLNSYKPIAKKIPEVFCYEATSATREGDYPISTKETTVPPNKRDYVHSMCEIVPIKRKHADLAKLSERDGDYRRISGLVQKFYEASKNSQRKSEVLGSHESTTVSSGTVRDRGFFVKVHLPQKAPFVSSLHLPLEEWYLKPLDKPLKSLYLPLVEWYLEPLDMPLKSERFAVITGPFRTALAREYAHRQKKQEEKSLFSSIFWLNAESEFTLESSFLEIADQLKTHYLGEGDERLKMTGHPEIFSALRDIGVNRQFTLRTVLDWFSYPENKRWLLIFNEVDASDTSYLQKYLPPIKPNRGYIIMTSTKYPSMIKNQIALKRDKGDETDLQEEFKQVETQQIQTNANVDQSMDETVTDYEMISHKLTEFPPRENGPPFMGASPSETLASALPAEAERSFGPPIRVFSFTGKESVTKATPPSDQDNQYQPSDETDGIGSEIPLDIAYAGVALSSIRSTRECQDDLENMSDQVEDITFDHPAWLDTCIMLSCEPIPMLLLERYLGISHEAVFEELNTFQRLDCLEFDPLSETFKISEAFRRLTRQGLEENFTTGVAHAESACTSVIDTVKYLNAYCEDQFARSSYEQLLLKHVSACLGHLSGYRNNLTCEWDVLAELCERHGIYSEAATMYRAAGGQHFTNSDTNSRLSNSYHSMKEIAMDDSWHDNDSSRSAEIWNNNPADTEVDFQDSARRQLLSDTKSSRMLRSKLGLVRVQLRLGRYEDLNEICQVVMGEIGQRREDRYISLKIQVLRQMVLIRLAKEEWSDAILHSYKLIETLEENFGPFAEDTVEAIRQLAEIHMDQGDFNGAIPLLEQLLMTHEQTIGNTHPSTITTLEYLSRAYREQGDYEKARNLYRRILKLNRDRLGEDHIVTAKTKESLAEVLDTIGEYRTADFLYEEALHAAKLLGEESMEYQDMLRSYESLQQGRNNPLPSQI